MTGEVRQVGGLGLREGEMKMVRIGLRSCFGKGTG